jgi:UDP-N-acetylmuramoyl-tripeptide--D-alanyl-D-alanine ligase
VELALPGDHMATNALAAITAARLLNIPFDAIKEGVESARPMFGRTQLVYGRVTVLQDCYNANPESVAVALALLAETPTSGNRIAVLGAMKELGDDSRDAHRTIVRQAIDSGADEIWLLGDEFDDLDRLHANVRVFSSDSWERLEEGLAAVPDGDTVLLKGSRVLELERLTPVIMAGSQTADRAADRAGSAIHG